MRNHLLSVFTAIGVLAARPFAAGASETGQPLVDNATTAVQVSSCDETTLSGNATSPSSDPLTLAFIDAGQDTVISAVCIQAGGFPGGEGGPFTSNGAFAGGCYVVDGIGTDVVAVFREDPSVRPDCEPIESITATSRPRLDLDCSGEVDSPDALVLLRVIAVIHETDAACPVRLAPGEKNLETVLEIRRVAAGLPAR